MANAETSLNCPLREAAAALIAHAGTRTFVAARGPEMDALRAALETPADNAEADTTRTETGSEPEMESETE